MNLLKRMIFGLMLFGGGLFCGKYLSTESDSSVQRTSALAEEASETPSAQKTARQEVLPSEPQKILKSSPVIEKIYVPPIFVSAPRGNSTDFGEDFLRLIESEFRALEQERVVETEEGFVVVGKSAEDGGQLLRLLDAEGTLIAETWKQISGTEISRDYYQGGQIRGFALRQLDGSATLVSFLETGHFKARVDEFPDGSKIATQFDDQGQVVSRTRIDREGMAKRIPL